MKAALLMLFPALATAQLMVYSEFVRLDTQGEVIAPEMPREILSPALVRNGYTSFQIVVDAAPDQHWRLFVGQNPEKAVQLTMYRKNGESLEKVELPVQGDGPQAFWMDLWTDRNAPVARIKVEPELYIKDDWVTYPMEGRVMEARVPDKGPGSASIKEYLCSSVLSAANSDTARLRLRNAKQDSALAALGSKDELRKLYGSCQAPEPQNPEWYLPIRDYLFRLR